MIVHVLLAITFWHCESVAAGAKTGTRMTGASFCKVGYRQSWPGEAQSLNLKGIESTHFWSQLPVINNCARPANAALGFRRALAAH